MIILIHFTIYNYFMKKKPTKIIFLKLFIKKLQIIFFLDWIIKKVHHHMMGSFDIHILDPNFMTWSNVYLSYLVLVQPRPWLERSDPEPLEVTGSHGKGRNVFLPPNGYTPIDTKMRQGKKVER